MGRCPMAAAKSGADIQQNVEEESGKATMWCLAPLHSLSSRVPSAIAEATLNSKLLRVDQLLWS